MDDRLTTAEAAEIINVSESTMKRYRKKNDPFIPYYRIGGRVWYEKADVQTFKTQQKRTYPPY